MARNLVVIDGAPPFFFMCPIYWISTKISIWGRLERCPQIFLVVWHGMQKIFITVDDWSTSVLK